MRNKKLIFMIWVIVLFSLLLACSEKRKIESALSSRTGLWSIDDFIYHDYQSKHCLLINLMILKKNKNLDLPISEDRCEDFKTYDEHGKWSIIMGDSIPVSIHFDTKNIFFKGTHQLIFYKDTINKLLMMQIVSDSLFLTARKGLTNFDLYQDEIDELIKITQRNLEQNKKFHEGRKYHLYH